VRDAVWKEWERLKSRQNNSFALLWNEQGLISDSVYKHKLKELNASTEKENKKARERRKAGDVTELMEEAVGCVRDPGNKMRRHQDGGCG
jgi:hypothetical protein